MPSQYFVMFLSHASVLPSHSIRGPIRSLRLDRVAGKSLRSSMIGVCFIGRSGLLSRKAREVLRFVVLSQGTNP